jgi:hypothetical protein
MGAEDHNAVLDGLDPASREKLMKAVEQRKTQEAKAAPAPKDAKAANSAAAADNPPTPASPGGPSPTNADGGQKVKLLFFNPMEVPLQFSVGGTIKDGVCKHGKSSFPLSSKAFRTFPATVGDKILASQGEHNADEFVLQEECSRTLDNGMVRVASLAVEGSPMAGLAVSLGRSLEDMEKARGSGGAGNDAGGGNGPMKKSGSTPALGSYQDLKDKTAFAGATTDGVLKGRPTWMTACSNFKGSPKFSMGVRGPNVFIRSNQGPAPGTYTLPPEEKSKYKTCPKFSFGGVSRFGLGESPAKKAPGPGAYNPIDPSLTADTKVGFGTAIRGRGSLLSQANPGPGAYEYRSCVGAGRMTTAAGRHPTSFMRARSLPGPGAYNPSLNASHGTGPKCGFGTSTRDDTGSRARNLSMPGPGAYELQNFQSTGSDAPKYSATSRRRVHDLNSYMSPGPGAYNAHVTSFGY